MTSLEQVLDRMHDALAVLDRGWRYQYVNARAAELSGLAVDQMLGRVIWDVFPALLGTEMERALRLAMAGAPQQLRFYVEPQRRWYDQRIDRLDDGLAILSTDVTEQARADLSDERFRTLAESMPQIVWTAAPDGTITFINRRWTAFTGLDLAATNAPSVADVFHPDDVERAFTRWTASLASGEPHEVEWRFRGARDGEYRWFLTRALPRRDTSGAIVEWFGTATDIHERKTAEHELRSANQTLAAVVRASPAAIMLLDGDGVVHMWNPAAEKIFGWSAEEVVGNRLPAIGPEQEDQFRANLARVLAGEVIEGVEQVRLRRDGAFHAAIWAAPVHRADGSTLSLSITADVTTRRRFEHSQRLFADAGQALAATLDLQDTLDRIASFTLDHLGDWCFVDLVTGDRDHFDRLACATRVAGKHDLARSFLRRYPLAPHLGGVARVLSTGEPVLMTRVEPGWLASLARDDAHRTSLAQLEARSFASAPLVVRRQVIGALSIVSSTTALDAHDMWTIENFARQAAAAIENARLFEAERHARDRVTRIQQVTSALSSARTAEEVAEVTCRIGAHAMDASGGVLWLTDSRGRLVIAGSWGTPSEWISAFRVLEPDDLRFPAVRVASTGEPVFVETRDDYARVAPEVLAQAEAAGRATAYAALPLVSDGAIGGVIVFSHPLGHRYDDADRAFYRTLAENCRQALQRARLLDEARVANRAKDEFLAMLGHELRNPLAPIVTALEMIRLREPIPSREHAIIERQVQHLRRMVDDLLDVSAIAAGRVQLDKVRVAIDDLIERAIETTRPLIVQRKHRIELDLARDLDVDGDVFRLTQVVTNLLTNAAKYTPPGGVVRVSARRDGPSITIRVADNGIGITPELLPRVFDLFQQGPQKSDRSQGGLGLGLSIVRSIVALHGGTVSAHSEGASRGSEFVVTLPAAQADPPAHAPAALGFRHPLLAGRRVLIVDDNEDAAVLLAEALRLDGAICHVVHSPSDAIQSVREFAADVALLDLGLPGMHGYELGRALRSMRPATRMIAVSGYGLESDRRDSHAAGFDGHLVKPVDLGALRQLISSTLAPR